MENVKFTCPECGHELKFMTSFLDFQEGCMIELYNCDKCGSAWHIKKIKNELEEPERYFFG